LSDYEAGVFFALILTAGIETTGTAIAHGLIALSEHAEQRVVWRGDLDGHTATAVEEIVRWATPVRRFRRTCVSDAVLGERHIRAGDKVVLWYMSANRDETVFHAPERFDVTREPNPHLGFGGPGPHFCLGANLARAEIAAFFRELLTRKGEIDVAGEVTYDVNDAFNVVNALPCRFG
jgi:cytochrome P450